MNNLHFIKWVFSNRNYTDIIYRLISLFLGYPLLLLSYLIPRSKRKWVLGYKVGFTDNVKYLYRYLYKYEKTVIPIWISSNKSEILLLREKGINAYYRWSLYGLYHCLTSYYYIFSSHLSDINYWTSGGCFAINLWHGVGIKKIEFATTVGIDTKIYVKNIFNRILFPYLFRKPDLFLSTSVFMSMHFSKCFQIDIRKCLNLGYPRCELFFLNANLIKKYVEEYEPQGVNRLIKDIQEFSHTIIYMPTFRDDQSDFMLASGINLDLLNDFLEKRDELFLFKLHPATVVSNVSSIFSNIRFLDKDVDVYPILPFTDLLITDYSSIFYDYLLLDKGIVLFPFDYEKYICQCRDLAFDFDDYTPGVRAYSFDSLMEILSDWNYGNSLTTEQNRIKKIFWGDIPMQNSCKVLTRYIINNGSSNNVDL